MSQGSMSMSQVALNGWWRTLALAAWLLAASLPAAARDLTPPERATLARTVASFEAAMRARRMDEVIGILPPRILAHIARQGGATPEALREMLSKRTSEAMSAVTLHAFGMQLAKVKKRQLADGTPYMLIPTEMTMEAAGTGKINVRSDTLAMMDEGVWYLLDVNQAPQLAIFTQVYPGFAGLEFGGKTTKVVP